ncbi:MAG: hypothetical protein ACFB6R_04155 [Alphaproteobacteria bacterium]
MRSLNRVVIILLILAVVGLTLVLIFQQTDDGPIEDAIEDTRDKVEDVVEEVQDPPQP